MRNIVNFNFVKRNRRDIARLFLHQGIKDALIVENCENENNRSTSIIKRRTMNSKGIYIYISIENPLIAANKQTPPSRNPWLVPRSNSKWNSDPLIVSNGVFTRVLFTKLESKLDNHACLPLESNCREGLIGPSCLQTFRKA